MKKKHNTMQVNGLIVDELNEKGELKSFVLNKDDKIGDLWIAFPEEYDAHRNGPYHFLDNSYDKIFSTFYKDKQMRKVGTKNFKQLDLNQFEFHTNWDNIPVRVSWELYYYSLYLPKFATPLSIDYKLAIRSKYDTNLMKVIKDKDRYVIYIMCKGSDDERSGQPQSLDLTVKYELNQESFRLNDYVNSENNDRHKIDSSHEEIVKDYHLFRGRQFKDLVKLIELLNDGHNFSNSQKLRLGQIQTDIKRILFVMSNPLKTTQLRLDEEYREIDIGLRLSNGRDNFELKITTATRPNDLRREMLRFQPSFLHFSGHGDIDGIALEDEKGESQIISNESLADLFSLFSDKIKCVLLNSCYSEVQAIAISKSIPYVVGMKKAIPDRTAIQFAVGFYDAIGAGRSIVDAFKFGKNAISMNNIQGEDIPQLIQNNDL